MRSEMQQDLNISVQRSYMETIFSCYRSAQNCKCTLKEHTELGSQMGKEGIEMEAEQASCMISPYL